MQLDYNSLLLALGVSASCLAVTLVGSWFSRRPETFLLTCSAGLAPIVAGIFSLRRLCRQAAAGTRHPDLRPVFHRLFDHLGSGLSVPHAPCFLWLVSCWEA